jgi:hypothetical protein
VATPKSILLMTSGLHVLGGADTSMVAASSRSSSTAATKPGEPVHSVPSSWACDGVASRTASVKARHNRQGSARILVDGCGLLPAAGQVEHRHTRGWRRVGCDVESKM